MPIHIVEHPLIQHKLGLMRRKDISTKDFRELASEMGRLLTYEATQDLATESVEEEGWAGPVRVKRMKGKKITVVPILRAGLGMMPGVLDLIPNARVSVIGLYRDEVTLEPFVYYKKISREIEARTALILDPMLATGGSLIAAMDMLVAAGCSELRCIHLVAAPEGLRRVESHHPNAHIYVAAVDQRLDSKGFILPGLGDAGDKIFGTK